MPVNKSLFFNQNMNSSVSEDNSPKNSKKKHKERKSDDHESNKILKGQDQHLRKRPGYFRLVCVVKFHMFLV